MSNQENQKPADETNNSEAPANAENNSGDTAATDTTAKPEGESAASEGGTASE